MKYTFSAGQRIQITGVGDFFRLLSTVGAVTVEYYVQGREIAERIDVEAGYAESFRTINFDRVDITSATAQIVQWETALGSEIRYDRGAATISGTVGLDSATLLALEQTNVRPESPASFWVSNAAFAANTAVQIFAPAANTNGVILHACNVFTNQTANDVPALIAKTGAAPTTVSDGEVIAQGEISTYSGFSFSNMKLAKSEYIAAGKGLWLITTTASVSVTPQRSARWTAL